MSDSTLFGRVGSTNDHSVSNVGQSCYGSDTLDRVDFIRNWSHVSDNTGLVYLHGLHNPDCKGFDYLQSDHLAPPLP